MRGADLAAAVIGLLVFGAMLFGASRFEYWLDFAPGPGFFPLGVALAGGAVSLVLLVGALRRRGPGAERVDWPDRAGARRVGATVAALVAVVPLVGALGFLAAAVLVMLFVLLVVERCRLLPSLATAALTGGLVYGVFGRWLHVPLPTGPLGF